MSKKASSKPSASIPQAEPRLLNVRLAASYLGIAVWCLRTLVWEKQIPPVKIGKARRLLFDRADLDAFIDAQKKEAA